MIAFHRRCLRIRLVDRLGTLNVIFEVTFQTIDGIFFFNNFQEIMISVVFFLTTTSNYS